MDYAGLGLKVGLEIHQQVDSKKLFCGCPSELGEDTNESFVRRLRPTQSELGEIDLAAIEEARKKLRFIYQPLDTTCLVEADEEPPHEGNEEAMDVALEIALLLGATPVDEIHFMRKIVIDGSNTAGFQRSALVAMNGELVVDSKTVPISMIGMEEDAARKIEQRDDSVVYRLDRLGIPLIEITTGPVIEDPDGARKVALSIGSLLRATKKVKRGIGTIRNDLNISIEDGARIEVKGVQELDLMAAYVENEVNRQLSMLEARNILEQRGVSRIDDEPQELTTLFKGTKCRVVESAIRAGGVVLGVRLPGFSNLLQNRLGPELNRYAVLAGAGGTFHSDELPAYGIEEEILEVREALGLGDNDAFLILAGKRDVAEESIRRVIHRARLALQGVPEETRDPRPDGTTVYSRPLPGEARMYPETDVPPIIISEERLSDIEAGLPELPEDKVRRLVNEYGIHEQQVSVIVDEGYDNLFEELIKGNAEVRAVASTISNTLPELEREGYRVDTIPTQTLWDLFASLREGLFTKEAVPEILRVVLADGIGIDEALTQLDLRVATDEEVKKIVREVVEERKEFVAQKGRGAVDPLMGVVMERLRGKANGKLVNEMLTKEIESLQHQDP